ncbi:MAG TPA: hypothetical protein PLC16_09245 [Defluviitaleaceae bacterium]|nr:hypothetical protein [Defluviitaleaceae bacterium]HPT76882.1 hypothetical protein [Defluviitaleaceae bacterium]
MEKKRNIYSYHGRRNSRNRKNNSKDIFLNFIMKQFVVSTFLFLLIIILNLLPLNITMNLMQQINERIYYSMTWDEAVETVKYTASRIPKVKNWLEATDETEQQRNSKSQESIDNNNDMLLEDSDIDTENKMDSTDHLEDVFDSNEDIFIIEPDLGESQEGIIP